MLCGGVDLCDERWDSPLHLYEDPRRSLTWTREHHGPYHDLAVQVTGPVCAYVQEHVALRWYKISSIPFPSPSLSEASRSTPGHKVYISRTSAPLDIDNQLRFTREIEFLTRDLIRRARKRIVLEGQYYWSETFNDALITKLLEMKGQPFELILICANLSELDSATRVMAYHESTLLRRLTDAARLAGTRITLGTPYVTSTDGARPKAVYVHSKLIAIDDTYLSIGSANFADRAFRSDTELNLTLEAATQADRLHIRRTIDKLLRHWNIRPSVHPVRLHPWRAYDEPSRLRRLSPGLTRIPWKPLFDPLVPWGFHLKRVFRAMIRARPFVAVGVLVEVWVLTAWASLLVAQSWTPSPAWTGHDDAQSWVYALALTSFWLVPIRYSFLFLAVLLHFRSDFGLLLALSAFWFSSLVAYFVGRIFPVQSTRLYLGETPHGFRVALRMRRFQTVLVTLADPRVDTGAKSGGQGAAFIPFPWFALANLVILPAAYYWLGKQFLHWMPGPLHWGSDAAAVLLVTTLAWGILKRTRGTVNSASVVRYKAPHDRTADSTASRKTS